MPLAVQYLKGGVLQAQFGLDVEDYTLSGGVVCNTFYSVKDSKDNIYIVCFHSSSGSGNLAKLIRLDKDGNKFVATQTGLIRTAPTNKTPILITRDELYLWVNDATNGWTSIIPTNFADNVVLPENHFNQPPAYVGSTAIYQDRYIWVASGTTVKIYDYTTKVELASSTIDNSAKGIILDSLNNLYVIESYIPYGFQDRIYKFSFNGVTISQSIVYQTNTAPFANAKQLLIDKYGDLIILTNTGTASTLLKYTTAGVQVGTTLTLGGAFYNLNTDKDGNYYYSNALGTYKITANTAQGEAFTSVGTKIRGSGMVTYGNNITNYNPAVFGTQE